LIFNEGDKEERWQFNYTRKEQNWKTLMIGRWLSFDTVAENSLGFKFILELMNSLIKDIYSLETS
jgi:hypothetical protein